MFIIKRLVITPSICEQPTQTPKIVIEGCRGDEITYPHIEVRETLGLKWINAASTPRMDKRRVNSNGFKCDSKSPFTKQLMKLICKPGKRGVDWSSVELANYDHSFDIQCPS